VMLRFPENTPCAMDDFLIMWKGSEWGGKIDAGMEGRESA